MDPNREFNITSYYGCYKFETKEVTDADSGAVSIVPTGFQGRDPNVFFEKHSSQAGRGCRGSLQGRTGLLFHDSVGLDGKVSTVKRTLPHNRLGEEERIET